MAIITTPTSLRFGSFAWGQKRYDLAEASDENGNVAARLKGPPRWTASIASADHAPLQFVKPWQTLILSLRGRINHLALWDIGRAAPAGTMRGTLTLNGAAAAGALSISVTGGAGQAGKTVEALDLFQIGTGLTSQLVENMALATANESGVVTLTLSDPLRIGYASGTVVTWDRPLAHFKMTNEATQWVYDPGFLSKSGYAADLLEHWT